MRDETWLDNDFDDLMRGADGPVEFRDVAWDSISSSILDVARKTYEALRERRRRPMSLKAAARMAIRAALTETGCVSCRGTNAGVNQGGALRQLTKILGLPAQLSDYVMFLND